MVAGVDEAGRGCLAGPVVAAAVILPEGYRLSGLTDSKAVSEKNRTLLRQQLERDIPKKHWSIGMATAAEVDQFNVLRATYMAMHRAIAGLPKEDIHLLLIDGNRFAPVEGLTHRCEVKGDARFAAISAASIFAKTERDTLMLSAHWDHPDYGWAQNKGYPTELHRDALERLGFSPLHRRTFQWKSVQWKLPL